MRSLLSLVRLVALGALCTALVVGCKKEAEPEEDPTAEAAGDDEGEAEEGDSSPKAKKGAKGEKAEKAERAEKAEKAGKSAKAKKASKEGDQEVEKVAAKGGIKEERGQKATTLEERRAEALAKRERVKKGDLKKGDVKKGDEERGESKKGDAGKPDAKAGSSKGGDGPPVLPREEEAQGGRVGVARLLTNSDLNAVLPMKGWVSHGPVPGIPPGEFYNSILYRIPNTSAFASIQVWDFNAPSMSLEKWSEIQATYPNVELYAEGFTKESLVSLRNQVSTYAFHEPKLAVVVAVSCNSQACDDTAIYRLAELIYGRLPRK